MRINFSACGAVFPLDILDGKAIDFPKLNRFADPEQTLHAEFQKWLDDGNDFRLSEKCTVTAHGTMGGWHFTLR